MKNDNIRRIGNDKTKKLYEDLVKVSRNINFSEPDYKDKEWLKSSIGALLVTDPIDNSEPFEVTKRVPIWDFEGKDFKVKSIKISADDTINGGRYNIHFYALTSRNELCYEFKGSVHEYKPHLQIKYAYIDEV